MIRIASGKRRTTSPCASSRSASSAGVLDADERRSSRATAGSRSRPRAARSRIRSRSATVCSTSSRGLAQRGRGDAGGRRGDGRGRRGAGRARARPRARRPRSRRAARPARTPSRACGARSGSARSPISGTTRLAAVLEVRLVDDDRRLRQARARARRSPAGSTSSPVGLFGLQIQIEVGAARAPLGDGSRALDAARDRVERIGGRRDAGPRCPGRGRCARRARSGRPRPRRRRSAPARRRRTRRPPPAARGTCPPGTRSGARSSRRAAPAARPGSGGHVRVEPDHLRRDAARGGRRPPRPWRPRRTARSPSGSATRGGSRPVTTGLRRGGVQRQPLERGRAPRRSARTAASPSARRAHELDRLEERLQAEPARAARQPARRQDVVRAGGVVAEHRGRVPRKTVPALRPPAAAPRGRRRAARGARARTRSRARAPPRATSTSSIRARPSTRGGDRVGERSRSSSRASPRCRARARPAPAGRRRTTSRIGRLVGDDEHLARPRGQVDRDRGSTTSSFAAVTQRLPGPTILSTAGIVSVPYASAATAWAPPIGVDLVESRARARSRAPRRGGRGVHDRDAARRRPRRAGTAAITSEEASTAPALRGRRSRPSRAAASGARRRRPGPARRWCPAGRCGAWTASTASASAGRPRAKPRRVGAASSSALPGRAARPAARRRAAPPSRAGLVSPRSRTSATISATRAQHVVESDRSLTAPAARPGRRGSRRRRPPSSGGSRSQISSASTAACTAICPGSASGSTDGAPIPGSSSRIRGQRGLRRVQHHVAAAAGGDDACEHQLEPVDQLAALVERPRFAISTASESKQRADPPEPVHARRRPGRDEVDDRVRQPEPRRRLDRARDGDELGLDADRARARPRRHRIGGRDAQAGEVGERPLRRAAAGTAASSVQRAKPSSASVTTSAPASTTRFAPVIPTWTTPSWTYSGMSCGTHEQQVDRRVLRRGRAARARPPRSESPAAASSSSAGGAIRPFEGTATSSRPFARPALIVLAPACAVRREREPVAAGAVAEPLRHAGDGRRARVHAARRSPGTGSLCSSRRAICQRWASASSSPSVQRSRRKRLASSRVRRLSTASASSSRPCERLRRHVGGSLVGSLALICLTMLAC